MGNTLSASYTHAPHVLSLGAKGALLGDVIDGRVCRFLGIPYAQPPVGELRWRRPRALPEDYQYGSLTGPLDCTSSPPLAMQPLKYSTMPSFGTHEYSEDCLTLNIWMPAGRAPPNGWPIMIWLHGGLLQLGDPMANPLHDPTEFVARMQCVVVAVTYRLSVFGFLGCCELEEEAKGNGASAGAWGNYGLWDQKLAIEWVQQHATLLGGDPGKITLAGLSAGAYSAHAQAAHALLSNSSSPPPFRRLIMYSNAIPTNPKTAEDVQPQFDELCDLLGVSRDVTVPQRLSHLRSLPAEQVRDAVDRMQLNTFRPVADGVFFPKDLMRRFERGDFAEAFKKHDMRLTIGETENEDVGYRMDRPPKDVDALRKQLLNLYSEKVNDVLVDSYHVRGVDLPTLAEDPNPDVEEMTRLYGRILGDCQVRAPERLLISQLEAAGVPVANVRRYRVAWRAECTAKVVPATMGVPHGGDQLPHNYGIAYGASERDKQIMDAWIEDTCDFLNGRDDKPYGTQSYRDVKVLQPSGKIAIEEDIKYDYLLAVAREIASVGG